MIKFGDITGGKNPPIDVQAGQTLRLENNAEVFILFPPFLKNLTSLSSLTGCSASAVFFSSLLDLGPSALFDGFGTLFAGYSLGLIGCTDLSLPAASKDGSVRKCASSLIALKPYKFALRAALILALTSADVASHASTLSGSSRPAIR
jgi:hypothetical protein